MANGIVFGIGKVEILPKDSVTPIEVGILQNVSIDMSTSQAELRGGGSLYPVAVVPTERSVGGSAEFAKFDGALLANVIGGTTVGSTLTVTDKDAPIEFKLTLTSPADGSDISIQLLRCISTSFNMSFAYNDFVKPNFDFSAMADDTGKVMIMTIA